MTAALAFLLLMPQTVYITTFMVTETVNYNVNL